MSVSPDVLKGPRLKVQRAHRHIDELRSLIDPLSRDLYTITLEPHIVPPQAKAEAVQMMYRPTKPIAETLAVVIGDAVHNLRGALDHLATGIARTAKPGIQIHFPMAKAREDIVPPRNPKGSIEKSFSAIEKALPGAERLILEKIRPANGGNERLWSFHALDNDDKHNLLIPTVSMTSITGLTAVFGNGSRLTQCGVGGNATRPINIFLSYVPFTMEGNFQTSIDVRFAHVDALKDEPVIPALLQTAELVSETINAFERLIAG